MKKYRIKIKDVYPGHLTNKIVVQVKKFGIFWITIYSYECLKWETNNYLPYIKKYFNNLLTDLNNFENGKEQNVLCNSKVI